MILLGAAAPAQALAAASERPPVATGAGDLAARVAAIEHEQAIVCGALERAADRLEQFLGRADRLGAARAAPVPEPAAPEAVRPAGADAWLWPLLGWNLALTALLAVVLWQRGRDRTALPDDFLVIPDDQENGEERAPGRGDAALVPPAEARWPRAAT